MFLLLTFVSSAWSEEAAGPAGPPDNVGTGVVIGESCIIGSHVKLYHAVTLGARSFQRDERGPWNPLRPRAALPDFD